jgi:hypothetical protein
MQMRQAGASRMLHCLAAVACEFMCEVSAIVQGIKTFKSFPEKHRSHPKNRLVTFNTQRIALTMTANHNDSY